MGKRKEHRMAAMTSAGRRLKLDLFAEPSGDLGGSTAHDEVEVDTESNQRSGIIPNSPSTSGQQTENPLLLLGQYSDDDELEEDSDNKPNNGSVTETSSPSNKDEALALLGEGGLDLDVSTHEIEQPEIKNDTASLDEYPNTEYVNKTVSDDTRHVSKSPTCENDPIGDVSSGWQVVLHEESNQCYYWNTETGETSWLPPDGLMQADELTHVVPQKAGDVSVSTGEVNLISAVKENLSGVENDAQNGINSDSKNGNSDSVKFLRAGNDKFAGDSVGIEDEISIDICSRLITLSEALLERLKSVKESKNQLQNLDCLSQYNLEVEIRLSDIKTLSSFGSSMHEFWVHSRKQLKRLEDSINLEIYKIAESAINGDTFHESPEHESEANGAANGVSVPCSESTPEHNSGPAEDIDMDVDMEVEDEVNTSDELPLIDTSSEAITVPPPPDEEWIPPPPPDYENIPPPPPDEPSEPKTYVDQNGLSIPNPDPTYYGNATGINYYGQVNGSQVVAPHTPIFYDSVLPGAYYEYQTGVFEPPQPQCELAITSYGILGSDHHMVYSNSPVEAAHILLPSVHESEVVPPIMAPVIVSESESVQSLSSSSVSASVSAPIKAPTKVAHSKKRTSAVAVSASLRSNKKVSNLVNKWKAAKEELLEDEEEPQTAFEMLERKRQKDIEEWKAHQIASGEAKSNANFQPLGGDWRERVKKRRAQKASGTARTSPQPHNDEPQKPDITQLSKDLPSGWQVYWDESSKQVYYGNVVTSETAWTRPAT